MKLSQGIQTLSVRNIESSLSKKILLANTSDKLNTKNLGVAQPSSPIYMQNNSLSRITNGRFSADIRYRNNYAQTALNSVYHRNNLLLFAENNEIKRALTAICNELIIADMKENKYFLYPQINLTQIDDSKLEVANAIQVYLDKIFYPKLIGMFGWRKSTQLRNHITEYLTCGKLAFEIVYDNLQRPKEIVNIIPIDTTELSKIKEGDYVWYVQKPLDGSQERVLHENQVILIEWNENDFGYLSYVETLKRSFNIMRGMQTSKILWFAVKSQVRMHIKLNMGDVARTDAINRLNDAKDDFINNFDFDQESGELFLNDEPNIVGYKEFFTAETASSGSPEIEEVNTQGPDLTEVESLQFWERMFWRETGIPFDRIFPEQSDAWSFADVNSMKKTENTFAKFIESIREKINELIIKPLIIQLTLKEVEIGVDLELLDQIKIEWIGFNQYDKLNDLELINRKTEIISNLVQFANLEDSEGRLRSVIPVKWLIQNYLDFSTEQLASMQRAQIQQDIELGYLSPEGEQVTEEIVEEFPDEETDYNEESIDEENSEETAEDIMNFEDNQ